MELIRLNNSIQKYYCRSWQYFAGFKHEFKNLKEIIIESTINESFSITKIIQYYVNNEKDNLEIGLELPVSKKMVLRKMKATMNGKVVTSKVFEKQKAEEKYNDAIASGNVGVLGRENENNKKILEVNIGNLQPGEVIEIETEFINFITCKDLSFYFSMNVFKVPNLIEYKKEYNENFKTFMYKKSRIFEFGRGKLPRLRKSFIIINSNKIFKIFQ